LFITHGGFGSTTEAVFHGVPTVGIPIFSDQEMNMKEMEAVGIGISLDFLKLNKDTFLEAIYKVLNDRK
jgi:glucuronosyltransferase